MKKSKKAVAFLFVAIFILTAGIAVFTAGMIFKMDEIGKFSDKEAQYRLVIEKDDYEKEISKDLKENGIIKFPGYWCQYMKKEYPDFIYINGEYEFHGGMTYEEIAKKLQNPDISHKSVKVVIPEGSDVFQIADILEKNNICAKQDFYNAVSTTDYDYGWLKDFPDSSKVGFVLEGFLFPATYSFGENSKATDIVDEMLDAFDERLTDDIKNKIENSKYSLFETVTLASVIQEEALSEESKANISSVLHNRLDKGVKLQCDVTYYYGKKLLDYGFSRDLYDTYYTYRCKGLPAGPISSPGTDMIEASLSPSDTKYMFFFSDLKGEFHFAETGEEFEKLKKQYPWKK